MAGRRIYDAADPSKDTVCSSRPAMALPPAAVAEPDDGEVMAEDDVRMDEEESDDAEDDGDDGEDSCLMAACVDEALPKLRHLYLETLQIGGEGVERCCVSPLRSY